MKKKYLVLILIILAAGLTGLYVHGFPVSGKKIRILDEIDTSHETVISEIDKEGNERILSQAETEDLIAELQNHDYRQMFSFGDQTKYSDSGYIVMAYLYSGDALTIEIYDLSRIRITDQTKDKSEYYIVKGQLLKDEIFE
jgi:hypothetical protein